MDVMQPHDRKSFTHQRVKAVADYDLACEMLMGRMSPGCTDIVSVGFRENPDFMRLAARCRYPGNVNRL
jgi:hypothetical protein